MPLGADIWKDTSLVLGDLAMSNATNLFTGQSCRSTDRGLPLAAALEHFPVALLSTVEDPELETLDGTTSATVSTVRKPDSRQFHTGQTFTLSLGFQQ